MKKFLILTFTLVLLVITFSSFFSSKADISSHNLIKKSPTQDKDTIRNNEDKAIAVMRLFHTAEVTYQAGIGNGDFGSAKDIYLKVHNDGFVAGASGGCPEEGEKGYKKDCVNNQPKDGYTFKITYTKSEKDKLSTFTAIGLPVSPKTGSRSFYVNDAGVIRYSSNLNVVAHEKSVPLGADEKTYK